MALAPAFIARETMTPCAHGSSHEHHSLRAMGTSPSDPSNARSRDSFPLAWVSASCRNGGAVANVLPIHVRVRIIHALCEGTSIRATARQTHTKKDTVMRLGLLVGLGCIKLHN